MDPILEEMRRVKDTADIRPARYRFWIDHLAQRIADLEQQVAQAAAPKARAKVGAA